MAKFGSTYKKLKDLNPTVRKRYGVYSRYDEYLSLFLDKLKIVKKSTGEKISYPVANFIKTTLCEIGEVGYDKISDEWAYVYGESINELGNPTTLNFVTANGKTWRRKAYYDADKDGAYLINALPSRDVTMGGLIRETTDFMTDCDVARHQNLEACKTPYIVKCKNKDLRLTLLDAIEQKQDGQAVIIVSEDAGESLEAINISVPYLVDKFTEARDRERDTLLNKLGTMTSNTNKKERVQSAEVNATIGQSEDYAYMIINAFNEQCESYGIDYEMQFDGSLEDIYIDANAVEKGENIND